MNTFEASHQELPPYQGILVVLTVGDLRAIAGGLITYLNGGDLLYDIIDVVFWLVLVLGVCVLQVGEIDDGEVPCLAFDDDIQLLLVEGHDIKAQDRPPVR